MGVSRRSLLTAGVCGVTAGAIVLNPSTVQPKPAVTPAFSYSAYSLGTADAHAEITPETVRRTVEFIESITTDPGAPTSVSDPGSPGTIVPPIDAAPAAADVEVRNAASDVINSVYAFTKYWANYVALDLGPWLINWIPFGYLVSDQINIWYQAFVLPVVDSFVYQFLDPVVNQPLNPGVWWNGAWAIANTALNGIVSGISSEVDYVFSLGWLPFPLPPFPAAPQGATPQIGDAALRMSLAAASGTVATGPTEGSDAPPDQPGAVAGGTVPPAADPAPDESGQTEVPAPEDDPTSVDESATAEPTPSVTTTVPTPDNSAPTTPATTLDPVTNPPGDDGTLSDQDGAEDPASGDTQDDADAPGGDDEVQAGDADDPADTETPADTPDTPDTPDSPAATAAPSTDTTPDAGADAGGSATGDGGDAGN